MFNTMTVFQMYRASVGTSNDRGTLITIRKQICCCNCIAEWSTWAYCTRKVFLQAATGMETFRLPSKCPHLPRTWSSNIIGPAGGRCPVRFWLPVFMFRWRIGSIWLDVSPQWTKYSKVQTFFLERSFQSENKIIISKFYLSANIWKQDGGWYWEFDWCWTESR